MKIIATLDSVDPVRTGGGVVFDGGSGPFLEWCYCNHNNTKMYVYRRHIADDILRDLSRVNVLDFVGTHTSHELFEMSSSKDVFTRAMLLVSCGKKYGWAMLDDEPLELSRDELVERWFPERLAS